MKRLYLQNHQLSGEIDLTQLPEGMNELGLQKNNLMGKIDLTHLPDGMQLLYFMGSVSGSYDPIWGNERLKIGKWSLLVAM